MHSDAVFAPMFDTQDCGIHSTGDSTERLGSFQVQLHVMHAYSMPKS